MHVQCCNITYDITAPFKDVTSANKMTCCIRSVPTPKLPKTAIDKQEHRSNGTPEAPGVPRNATYISQKNMLWCPTVRIAHLPK